MIYTYILTSSCFPDRLEGRKPVDFSQTTISVKAGAYIGMVDREGNFNVRVPGPGMYKVEVQNRDFMFEPVIVEIYEEEFAEGKDTKAFLASMTKAKDYRLTYPLQLDPTSRFGYFEVKPPFDPMAYLKNPFVIMIGVSLLMSQMMKNVDMDEMKKAQAEQGDAMKDMPAACQQ